MAFPNNPSNGDTFVRYGRTYQYDSTMLMWKVPKSGIQLTELSDIDITTTTPVTGDVLIWSGTKFEPDSINILSMYQSELPLAGNVAGQMAYVTDTSRLYIYTGAGWFNVALVNTNPTITVGPDGGYAFATDGTPIVLTLEAQDPEELPIAWSYVVTSGVLGSTATVQQEGNVFTITPSTDGNDAGEFSITFTASDGVNLATAVSSFTLVFATDDQYYNKNSLLLKSGSTAGLNNNTFVDESTNDFTVTPTGDVYQGSLSPYSPAGWSGYFDGTGDNLVAPSNAAFAFGTGDFTIEMWVYIPTNTGTYQLFYNSRNNGTGFCFGLNNGGLNLMYFNGGILISDPTNFTLNQWTHVALVRNAGTTRIYRNGVVVGTPYADSINYTSTVTEIGRDVAFSYNTRGFISNVRIVKGTAVYTSNFTPPTEPLTATAGTSLLTCQSNRFIDNSTNNFTITRTGDPSVQSFSPYLPSVKYDPTIHGGSTFFDGTGDYLSTNNGASSTIGTSDFTYEAWVYPTANNTWQAILGSQYGANGIILFSVSATNLTAYGSGNLLTFSSVMRLNEWQHVALTRESGNLYLYHNGIKYSSSAANNTDLTTYPYQIGANGTGGEPFWGYIADARIVKGTAVYTSDFTPPTQRLTAISGTSLLLNMNNAGIYDEMSKNNIKVIGNATTSTTQTKYSDASMYFDGTGDYVTSSTTAGVMGTDNFTIETWVYPTTSGTSRCIINTRTVDGSITGFYLGLTTSQYAMFYVPGVGAINTPQNSILADSWYHIAVVRNANIVNLYLNGVSVGSSTIGSNFTDTLFQIGGCPNVTGSSANYFTGYLEDFRITNGVARYTANFTPPTAALGFNNAE